MDKRKATYKISIPLVINFVAENDIDANELEKVVEKKVYEKLADGNFEVYMGEYNVLKKRTHYTSNELKDQKKLWDNLFNNIHSKRGK